MVSELLGRGAAAAIPGRELARALNINLRTVTEQIKRERRAGIIICANMRGPRPGYYLAATEEERTEYCEKMKSEAIDLFKTRKAMLKADLD